MPTLALEGSVYVTRLGDTAEHIDSPRIAQIRRVVPEIGNELDELTSGRLV